MRYVRHTIGTKNIDIIADTEVAVVNYNPVTDLTSIGSFNADDYQPGDEILNQDDGYVYKMKAGTTDASDPNNWEPNVDKPRVYIDEAARAARTGFTPLEGEEFFVQSNNRQYVADAADPTDETKDNAVTDGSKVNLSDKAVQADIDAGTPDKWVDAKELREELDNNGLINAYPWSNLAVITPSDFYSSTGIEGITLNGGTFCMMGGGVLGKKVSVSVEIRKDATKQRAISISVRHNTSGNYNIIVHPEGTAYNEILTGLANTFLISNVKLAPTSTYDNDRFILSFEYEVPSDALFPIQVNINSAAADKNDLTILDYTVSEPFDLLNVYYDEIPAQETGVFLELETSNTITDAAELGDFIYDPTTKSILSSTEVGTTATIDFTPPVAIIGSEINVNDRIDITQVGMDNAAIAEMFTATLPAAQKVLSLGMLMNYFEGDVPYATYDGVDYPIDAGLGDALREVYFDLNAAPQTVVTFNTEISTRLGFKELYIYVEDVRQLQVDAVNVVEGSLVEMLGVNGVPDGVYQVTTNDGVQGWVLTQNLTVGSLILNANGKAEIGSNSLKANQVDLDVEIATRTSEDDALTSRLDALPAPFSKDYNDLTNQPIIPVVSTDVDFNNDPTAVADRATLKTALDSLDLGKWLPEVATIVSRDGLTGVVENDKVRVTDAGSSTWVNYQATADDPTPTQWQIISEEAASIPSLLEADAITGTQTTDSSISAKTLDTAINAIVKYDVRGNYGLNQKVYDDTAGGYFKSIQANNEGHPLTDAAWWEADLDETAVYIRNLGAVATLTDTALSAKFPVGDEARALDVIEVGDVAYQMRIGVANPQLASSWEPVSIPSTRILESISVGFRSSGTNSSSYATLTFVDRDGNNYAPNNFKMSGTLATWAGGGADIVHNDAVFNGLITLGRNRTGTLSFVWDNSDAQMNGLSQVIVGGGEGGTTTGNVIGQFLGSAETFSHPRGTTIVPAEEFTSQPRVYFDDNADLTQNTGVGITRGGLAALLNAQNGLSTIQAVVDQDLIIQSGALPSFIHLNGNINGGTGLPYTTEWDVSAALDGSYHKVKAFQQSQILKVTGATLILDPDATTPPANPDEVLINSNETIFIHHTLNAGNRFVNVERNGSGSGVSSEDIIVVGGGAPNAFDPFDTLDVGQSIRHTIIDNPQIYILLTNPSNITTFLDYSLNGVVTTSVVDDIPSENRFMSIPENHTLFIDHNGTEVRVMVTENKATSFAKNVLTYPVGDFTAIPVSDNANGNDGAVYKIPNIDNLIITLPNKADMDAAIGIFRVRISGDWAELSAQTTPLSFVDDTANGVEFGTGLPDSGNEWIDIVYDAANDKWIATSGGDVTLTQIIPTYAEHVEVPVNVRLYLTDGTGAAAEGLWRKETVGDAPNYIG